MTRTMLTLAILVGTASASFAMSPSTGGYPNAYAKAVVGPVVKQQRISPTVPTQSNLADRQSAFYRI
jgi:hypothetical protein